MANDVKLRSGNTYTRTVRMDAESVKLDPKDPIGAACLAKVVRDVQVVTLITWGISVLSQVHSLLLSPLMGQ